MKPENLTFKSNLTLKVKVNCPPPKIEILTKVFSTSGPNLVFLAWMGNELLRGQAQNGVNFYYKVKFDLKGQGQSPPKTRGILTKVFSTSGPNLVVLAWTGDELLRGQTWWRTDGHVQAVTIPAGQNWPRVKIVLTKSYTYCLEFHSAFIPIFRNEIFIHADVCLPSNLISRLAVRNKLNHTTL